MRDNWKTIAAVAFVVGLVALIGLRVNRSFAPRAPAVLNYEQHSSPGFTFDGDLRRAWKNVEALLTLARREEKATLLQLATLSFVQICQLPNDALLWDTIVVRNPGFESLRRIERIEPGPPAKLIGYYTLDGKPLDFDTKTDLRNTPQKLTTVDLNTPIPAGKSVMFFRVQRAPSRVSTNAAGKCSLALGRLSTSPSTIHLISLALPRPAQLVRYIPDNARVTAGADMNVLTWLSSQTDESTRAVHVTFTIPK
jgi:hypothetical protein